MKKILSFILLISILCSSSSIAFAEYKTLIRSVGLADCEWELTVPIVMSPGEVGEVTLEGTWDSNTTVKVSTPEFVTITNDLDGETENLEIAFFDISKKGDNRNPISLTRKFSVAQQQQMLFGTWEGYFNYYVTVESSNPLYDGGIPALKHDDEMPEGASYYSRAEEAIYSSGSFPDLSYGDIYIYGDYQYEYIGIQNLGDYGEMVFGGGWTVSVNDKSKTSYGPILSSINNAPVIDLGNTFQNCTNLVIAPEIPDSIIGMCETFSGCYNLVTMFSIPESVCLLYLTFSDCKSLTGEIEINSSNVYSSMDSTFEGTDKSILLYGDSPYLEDFAVHNNLSVRQ